MRVKVVAACLGLGVICLQTCGVIQLAQHLLLADQPKIEGVTSGIGPARPAAIEQAPHRQVLDAVMIQTPLGDTPIGTGEGVTYRYPDGLHLTDCQLTGCTVAGQSVSPFPYSRSIRRQHLQ